MSKSNGIFSAQELSRNLLDLLRTNPETIQEDILNLVGFEEFEFIERLLANRESVMKSAAKEYHDQTKNHVPGTKVTLKGERLGRHFATEWEFESEDLGQLDLIGESGSTGIQVSYPHVYGGKKELTFGTKLALPIGTEHNDKHTYEEFIIPHVVNQKTPKPNIELVKIANLDAFARAAFVGYTSLNLMQSIVYETAFFSNENMLVSAPTGAGKTDVAMLAVLKAIRDNLSSDPNSSGRPVVDLTSFKIVYVAPMKALATEIVGKFSKRLAALGVSVREYTGDMQLTRQEIQKTQMIVTTPEKWDVITRKSHGDLDLVRLVNLLVIDEVHLLHDSRGPVLESIVARTLREVEISQRMIRIVGLSATLPNYVDVALFLRVNPFIGMFFFDDSFRPIPLTQHFVGIKGKKPGSVVAEMNRQCFAKALEFVQNGHQVMVFVHSRNDTSKTAKTLLSLGLEQGLGDVFVSSNAASKAFDQAKKEVAKSRNNDLKSFFSKGLGIHHAGMLRSDRLLTERLFLEGHVRVLMCTATLAWGVNLPAHAVIIKGTQVYDSEKGEFTDLGILNVLQIFGRAGRPQFETHGEGIILTAHDKLFHYLNAIMCQNPIESQFLKMLPDNLNAEIALGTVSNVQEALAWLSYTYLSVRMRRNPLAYGITPKEKAMDPQLQGKTTAIIKDVAIKLRNCGMIIFDNPEKEGFMRIRNVGRLASIYYLKYETIEHFGKLMNPRMSEEDILSMVCECSEFEAIKVRDDELDEIEELSNDAPMLIKGDPTSTPAKVSLLIQTYISRHELASFSLQSDMNTIRQNAGRIFRAVFEIVRSQEWAQCSLRALRLSLCFEHRVWAIEHPLAQFEAIPRQVARVLYDRGIRDMQTLLEDFDGLELARVTGQSSKLVPLLRKSVLKFPKIRLSVSCQPVLPTILSLKIELCVDFLWDLSVHGAGNDIWWLWVEDEENCLMKHCEQISTSRHQVGAVREVEFYIAIDPKDPPAQLYIRAVSNRWLHASEIVSLPLRFYSSLLLTDRSTSSTHTDLLPVHPIPISALHDSALETLYSKRFLFFNSIQSQAFHTLYHQSPSVLIGAPTGSGKTVLAELAMWQALRSNPQGKVVYIAPLKALVKERLEDWRPRLMGALGISVVELTGDLTPDNLSLQRASLILTTPEKWDGVSRNWQSRQFVSQVSLIILDEIHLLGSDRGHVLEMIVSRMRRLVAGGIRLIGLSTAMANARDLAEWLSASASDLKVFNFRPSVRPVPLQVYLEGYADIHYCPRMATMNKPIYTHILTLSPDRPVLIFVSSRRQTRLTAQALISLCVNDDQPHRFIMAGKENLLSGLLDRIVDPVLKHCMGFGVAMHHAGMPEADRKIAEEAFSTGLVQVLVATSTVAWGVNFPAHLVIVKGTEFFDARIQGYKDLPVTDILQMVGRAGRPQFDTTAKAVILAQDSKKYFYKRFLYEPFPIESCLHSNFADHLNAEIATGQVKSFDEAVQFLLNQTYFGVRIRKNPLFYGAEGKDSEPIAKFTKTLVARTIEDLKLSGCIDEAMSSTTLGRVGAKFYLSHRTMRQFLDSLDATSESTESVVSGIDGINKCLRLICFASEFDSFPLRHNEDSETAEFVAQNRSLIEDPFLKHVAPLDFSKPHAKVYVLLRSHLLRIPLPFLDFEIDLKLALEQVQRVLAGLIDLAAREFRLNTLIDSINLGQLIKQRCWLQSSLLQIPHFSPEKLKTLQKLGKRASEHICDFLHAPLCSQNDRFRSLLLNAAFSSDQVEEISIWLRQSIPKISVKFAIEHAFPPRIFVCKVSLKDEHRKLIETKDDGFICFIGDSSTSTLLTPPIRIHGSKLLSTKKPYAFKLQFESQAKAASLFIISELFYGLDQVFEIPLLRE